MPAQQGRALIVRLGDGGDPESFTAVAGLRATTIALNAEPVDVTSAQSAGAFRERLAGAGVKSCEIRGAGVFRDAASDARLRALFFDQGVANAEIVIPDFGTIAGPFQVAALDYAAQHDREVTIAMTLASAGELAFTPE